MATYLIASDDDASVSTTGAATPLYSVATRSAAPGASDPITTRSGFRKSCSADPSRRNSGLDATATSARSSQWPTRREVPTGTVDFTTTTDPESRYGAISVTAASR